MAARGDKLPGRRNSFQLWRRGMRKRMNEGKREERKTKCFAIFMILHDCI